MSEPRGRLFWITRMLLLVVCAMRFAIPPAHTPGAVRILLYMLTAFCLTLAGFIFYKGVWRNE